MEHLTGLDAAFLAMESPQEYLHIGSVGVLDPSTAPEPLTLERFTEHVVSRLHLVPLMRRRLLPVPLGLDQPYWVSDGEPDLRYHVRGTVLAAPGDDILAAMLLAYYPISAIVHGQGLNITAMSCRDRLCFGLLACRRLVPDLAQLAVWLGEELRLLSDEVVPTPALAG